MTGRQFAQALEAEGFVIRRRSTSYVWMARGEQTLMIDIDATMPDGLLERLLADTTTPPSRRSRPSALGRPHRRTPKP
jgi:hypothetical protein